VRDVLSAAAQELGKPVTSLIPHILESLQDVASITLVMYRPAPALGERLSQHHPDDSREIWEQANSLHKLYGIGFWDAVLAMTVSQGQVASRFIDLALLHDAAPDEREIKIQRHEVTRENLERIVADAPGGYGVALSSKMTLFDGESAHIPMLDFRCPHSDQMVLLLKRALRALGQRKGVLVQSPRSYHYYGLELVSQGALTDFLARSLLIAPIVDARYIAHRLIDKVCRLRLGSVANKGAAPVILEIIDDSQR
jgi:hypothetical protein